MHRSRCLSGIFNSSLSHRQLLLTIGLAGAAAAAHAQQAAAPAAAASAPEAGKLQSVTVTAQRQTENIKDVPVSVFTLGGEKLDVLNSGGQDVRLLSSRVPSLNIESSFGRAFPRFYIRGYGNVDFHANASQPVSLIYDDVVEENPLLKGFPMFDLDRVEILAGPQGTLFGRNTPAGVVKFESAKPAIGATDGYGSISYGRFGTINGEGAASVPINDQLAARVSLQWQHRDDWVHNTFDGPSKDLEGYNDRASRLQLLYKPRGDFSALFNVHARVLDGTARLFRANIIQKGTNNLVPGFDPSQVSMDGQNDQRIQNYGGNVRLKYDIDQYSLYSISGYETVHSYSRGDIDGGFGASFAPPFGPGFIPFPSETAGGFHDHKQLTQEFRVESHYAGPLNWQSGLYGFYDNWVNDSYSYDSLNGGVLAPPVQTDQQKNTSWALFGSVKYDVTKEFNVRAGLRYTSDKKNLNSNPAGIPVANQSNGTSAETKDSKVSGDLSVDYAVTPRANVYARVATGYRGSSIQAAGAFNAQSQAGPETVTSVEAGVKAELFDQRARVAFDVFHYDVKDLQLTAIGGASNASRLLSANKATGQGFEFSLDAYLTDALLITFSGSYNDTKIKDPNLVVVGCAACTVTNAPGAAAGTYHIDGNPLPQAPKYIANVTARYGMPVANGEAFIYTDWAYRSSVNFFLYESREFTGKPLTEGGLRIGYNWADGKYELAAYGRNITNRIVAVGGIDFNNLTGFINDPRTYGIQFKARF